jgi:hypothetical protein
VTVAGIATTTLLILITATVVLGAVIALLALALAAGDDEPENRQTLVRLEPASWAAVFASVLENLGYRQLTAFWHLQGASAALVGTKQEWGDMTRTRFVGRRSS